jgi:hypothetical protein
MSTLTEIEEAVSQLPREEFAQFSAWMIRRYNEEWDRQIEEDSVSGALAGLLQEVSEDIVQGRTKGIDEVCNDE